MCLPNKGFSIFRSYEFGLPDVIYWRGASPSVSLGPAATAPAEQATNLTRGFPGQVRSHDVRARTGASPPELPPLQELHRNQRWLGRLEQRCRPTWRK